MEKEKFTIGGISMFCSKCGFNAGNARFCPKCGAEISQDATSNSSPSGGWKQAPSTSAPKKKGCAKPFFITMAIVIIISVGITAIAIIASKNAPESVTSQTSESVEFDETDYRLGIEQIIRDSFFPDADFDLLMNYRSWTDGTFTYVENHFSDGDDDHTYVARCGDGKIFHLSIDGETVYYDEEGQIEFMDSMMEESSQQSE